MQAIFIEKFGPPEVLRQREVSLKPPNPEEVQVEVSAAGVNFADLLQRLHLYGSAPDPPYIPGFEVAGRVREAGEAISHLSPGDRVFGLTSFGGYAERVNVEARQLQKTPDELDDVRAAAIPVNFLTAWFCLFEMGRLQEGKRVLIHGGAGGVGSAAVQLAVRAEATVAATAGSRRKVEFLRDLGVDLPICYREEDFTSAVRSRFPEGLDLVLDPVGGRVLEQGYELLRPLGRLVSYGLSSAAPSKKRTWLRTFLAWWRTPHFKPLELIGRNVGVYGFHLAHLQGREEIVRDAFEEMIPPLRSGQIQPVIARTFPLNREGAVAAHEFLHDRRNIGKVVLSAHD